MKAATDKSSGTNAGPDHVIPAMRKHDHITTVGPGNDQLKGSNGSSAGGGKPAHLAELEKHGHGKQK